MIGNFRIFYRLLAVLLWCLAIVPVGWLLTLGHGRKMAAWCTQVWARGIAYLINLKVQVPGGAPKLQHSLIVSNHQSYLDILVIASLFELRFAPKIEMKNMPFVGFMTSINRPIWVDRSSRLQALQVARQMEQALDEGSNLIVYPEGTTADSSQGLLPFKSTPFAVAEAEGVKVRPVLNVYCPEPEIALPWVNNRPIFDDIRRVLSLKRIGVKVYIMPEITAQPGEGRKNFARRVHDLMDSEYRRVSKNAL